MINREHKLTVDDLIVEYMIFKVKEGYEPSFTSLEFIDFLHFFTSKMYVEDCLYNNGLFFRFFERKRNSDWSYPKTFSSNERICNPHMELNVIDENKYLIKAKYNLSDFDISVINTYFMSISHQLDIRDIIKDYLKDKDKRTIDLSIKTYSNETLIGKCIASQITENIWLSHINKLIESGNWPRQCKDINKYLLYTDLAKKIELPSIKDELLELYKSVYPKIAIMYHQDNNLKISTYSNTYLANSNYNLLRKGHEKMFDIAYGKYKNNLDIDVSKKEFTKIFEKSGVYYIDDDIDYERNMIFLNDNKVKRLVRNLDRNL